MNSDPNSSYLLVYVLVQTVYHLIWVNLQKEFLQIF